MIRFTLLLRLSCMSAQFAPKPGNGSMGKSTGHEQARGVGVRGNAMRTLRPARSGLAAAICAALAAGALLSPTASAQVWTGNGATPDWSDGGNWQGGNVPGGGMSVNPRIRRTDAQGVAIDGVQVGVQNTNAIHDVVVGDGGGEALLTIRNGGGLHSGGAIYIGLGDLDGASSGPISIGTVQVTGAGSRLTSGSNLILGGYSAMSNLSYGDGRLLVEDGGEVVVRNTLVVGSDDDSLGLLTLGGGSRATSQDLAVASGNRTTGTVRVSGGSTLETIAAADIGYSGRGGYVGWEGGSRGSVTVTGADSLWAIGGHLAVSPTWDTFGRLVVSAGGRVTVARDASVGVRAGSDGAVQVSGAGSHWDVAGTLTVASSGFGRVNVDAGGLATSAQADIGSGSNGASERADGVLTVTGADSRWSNGGDLRIGVAGGEGLLNVFDGASASTQNAYIGHSYAIGSGTAHVSGAGSRLSIGELLRVGQGGATGHLRVSDGGHASAAAAEVGYDGLGHITVEGTGSLLEIAGNLDVHGFRGDGTMTIADGGRVRSGAANIGTGGLNGWGHVAITGVGSVWESGHVQIGSDGREVPNGTLTLSDGGRVSGDAATLGYGGVLAIGGGIDGDRTPLAATAAGVFDVEALSIANPYQSYRGTLLFNHTDTGYAFGTALSGTGRLQHVAGDTRLTGDSRGYTGTTAVAGGTLLVDGTLGGTVAVTGGTFGGSGTVGAVTVGDGATFSPGGMDAGTFTVASLALSEQSILRFDLGTAGVVGGADNDLVEVAGALVLDGQLHIDAAPAFGNGVYRLFNYGGALTDRGLDFAGVIGGGFDAAAFDVQTAISGQVNLVVGGIAAPILFWQGGSGTWDASSQAWTDANGTRSDAWSNTFAVFQGAGGTVTVQGTQQVTGLQFAGNGYTIAGGTGSALELTQAETIVRVDPGNTATLSVALTGAGALVRRDAGTLVLSGDNRYSGGTQLFEGVLEVAADGALGAASGSVAFRGGTLRVGDGFGTTRGFEIGSEGGRFDTGTGSARYAGALSGSGAFHRVGSGLFEFAGDGSDYDGVFGAGGGRFHLTGVLGGTLDIAAGTTLSGTGRAHDLRIGGRLAPGNSIGTLSVSGDATFLPGSTFEVEVAASGSSDLLDVAGRVDIQGGTVEVVALDPHTAYTDGSTFTFLRAAGGIEGTFGQLLEQSAFLDFSLGYSANSAFLTLAQVATFPDVAATFNQQQSSAALQALTPSGDALALYNAILMLDAGSARNAFDAASGEVHAGAQQAMTAAGTAFNRALLRGPDALEGRGLWVTGVYTGAEIDGDGNAAALDYNVNGLAVGYRDDVATAAGHWSFGVAVGATDIGADVDDRSSRARGDARHAGVHVGWSNEAWRARASLGYMEGDLDLRRDLAIGDVARQATSRQSMDAVGFSGELLWRLVDGDVDVAPLLSVDAMRGNFDATVESGADALGLTLARQRHEQLDVGVGVAVSGAFGSGGPGGYELRAAYVQDVAADRNAERSAWLDGSPVGLIVRGPAVDKDRILLGAGVSMAIADGMSLGLRYEGAFAGSGNAHAATMRFDWRF